MKKMLFTALAAVTLMIAPAAFAGHPDIDGPFNTTKAPIFVGNSGGHPDNDGPFNTAKAPVFVAVPTPVGGYGENSNHELTANFTSGAIGGDKPIGFAPNADLAKSN